MNPTNDHDLLIRLDTQMRIILEELKDIKTNISVKVNDLEVRVSRAELAHKDYDRRLGNLEAYQGRATDALDRAEKLLSDPSKVNAMLEWWETYTTSWKWIVGGISTIAAVASALLIAIVQTLHLFGHG